MLEGHDEKGNRWIDEEGEQRAGADEKGMLASKLPIRNCGRLSQQELKGPLQQDL